MHFEAQTITIYNLYSKAQNANHRCGEGICEHSRVTGRDIYLYTLLERLCILGNKSRTFCSRCSLLLSSIKYVSPHPFQNLSQRLY